MKIVFLLPGLGRNVPIGGFKVVYEYANRFSKDGFLVDIHYLTNGCGRLRWLIASFKCLFKIVAHHSGRDWFNLDDNIQEHVMPYFAYHKIRRADCYVATSASTAVVLNKMKVNNRNKFYFIQGYDEDTITKGVEETFFFGMSKIVISKELQSILNSKNLESEYIPNGFDFNYFKCFIPTSNRNKYSVSMIYCDRTIKGCKYGLEALRIVKERYSNLRVVLFGTSERPSIIPNDYEYYQQPNQQQHLIINNECSIFIATSLNEGWGLPVGEAMICGQAVICTDNGGYREMAINGQNSIVVPIKDYNAMANAIIQLIENDDMRISLANNGMNYIKSFTWERSYVKFKHFITA